VMGRSAHLFDACGVGNSNEVLQIVLDAQPACRERRLTQINRAVKFLLVVLGGNTCSSCGERLLGLTRERWVCIS
jgi:hypothetical protein